MHSSKLSVAAGVSLALQLATAIKPEVNVYFGQYGTDTLASYCDSGGFDSVTLAFLSAAPEADPATNYPATEFGTHCGTDVYFVNNTASRLLSGCTGLASDIQYCQRLGKKVLLSTGGVWSADPAHNYAVTTEANGEYFADFLWNAFGAYNASWAGPRPFDTGSDKHTVLDGFDFDIEVEVLGQKGYIAMLKRLRSLVNAYNGAVGYQKVLITGAPQCPLLDGWADMKEIISTTAFDRLWIQFYNNNLCQAGTARFNYAEWETFISDGASQNARLYVGLPASMDTAGYISADEAITLVDTLRSRSSFGGVMIWDASIAKVNAPNGVPMYQAIKNHMDQVLAAPSPSLARASTAIPAASSFTSFSGNHSHSSIQASGHAQPTSLVTVTDPCTSRTRTSASSSVPTSTVSTTPVGSGAPTVTHINPSHTFSPVASAQRAQTKSNVHLFAMMVITFIIIYA